MERRGKCQSKAFYMKRVWGLAVIFLLFLSGAGAAAQTNKLSAADLLRLLDAKDILGAARVEEIIAERGLDFEFDYQLGKDLEAGITAGTITVKAETKAKPVEAVKLVEAISKREALRRQWPKPVISGAPQTPAFVVTNLAAIGDETKPLTNVFPASYAVVSVTRLVLTNPVSGTTTTNYCTNTDSIPTQSVYVTPGRTNSYFLEDFSDNRSLYYTLRAGWDHSEFVKSGDTWWLSASLYGHNQELRSYITDNVRSPGWGKFLSAITPDVYFELSHQIQPINTNTAGATNGVLTDGARLLAGAFWPLLSWPISTPQTFGITNFSKGTLHPTLGPVFEADFNTLFDSKYANQSHFSGLSWSYYGGARLALSPYAYVQYEVGKDSYLQNGLRYHITSEIPLAVLGGTRVILRTIWDCSDHHQDRDFLDFVIMVQIPFDKVTAIPFNTIKGVF